MKELLLFILIAAALFCFSEFEDIDYVKSPLAVKELKVSDMPGDDGTSLMINWFYADFEIDEMIIYCIFREDTSGRITKIREFDRYSSSVRDVDLKQGEKYRYFIVGYDSTGNPVTDTLFSEYCTPEANLFKKSKTILFILIIAYALTIIILVEIVRKGKKLFLRKMPGLDALDEAVGRATEMGRPILYVPGLSSMSDIATIASLNILGPVAKKVAEYDTRIIVPNRDPIVMTVAREVVKESYIEAGRPDAYSDNDVFFLTDSQFGFAAAVNGIMVREKPATNLFLGMFWAESLILAETGNTTGAIQIAGTDAVAQLPFFITSCDYTIIGEELYAASAYLSNEPILMGSIKAQDYLKALIILIILIFFVLFLLNLITGEKIEFIKSFMLMLRSIFKS